MVAADDYGQAVSTQPRDGTENFSNSIAFFKRLGEDRGGTCVNPIERLYRDDLVQRKDGGAAESRWKANRRTEAR